MIDIGPGAGKRGGVSWQGTAADLAKVADSTTGRMLAQPLIHLLQPRRVIDADTPRLTVLNASLHNLRGLDVDVPLQRLVAVTGVSGSGKARSPATCCWPTWPWQCRCAKRLPHGWVASVEGHAQVDRVLEVDQTPSARPRAPAPPPTSASGTPSASSLPRRSKPRRGYAAGRFSFNTGAGRCPGCEGQA